MTTDERAAVERLRKHRAASQNNLLVAAGIRTERQGIPYDPPMHEVPLAYLIDLGTLATAYIAMHDPTPITEELLRGLGGVPSSLSVAVYGFNFDGPGIQVNVSMRHYKDDRRWMALVTQDEDSIDVGVMATLGDLTRLLDALGIQPKERQP